MLSLTATGVLTMGTVVMIGGSMSRQAPRVRSARMAVVCCRRPRGAGPSDLYPDPDAAPLQDALRELGAGSALVSWDDPAVAWGAFSHVVVSSTWDSVDRPGEYLAWARAVSQLSMLVNPVKVIEWNLDKVHQQGLGAAGVPVVPTAWVAPGDPWELPGRSEFVVKPSVSAGGRGTARYAPGDDAALAHVRGLQASGQTVMVQDYMSGIDSDGEVDLVFFAGELSHAVLKKPALQAGEGVINRPWERMEWSGLTTPSPEQFETARLTMAVVSHRFGAPPAYARVDLVNGPGSKPLLLEVELIDPYLSLDTKPAAAARLAEVLLRPDPFP
ncbi:MAG: ATP-grasp domain-containing protein [Acidimicrobiales bacterium]